MNDGHANFVGMTREHADAEARRIRTWLIAATLYVLVACVSFGHCAAHSDSKHHERVVTGALFAGMLWPCYWSWVAFEKPKAPPAQQVEAL